GAEAPQLLHRARVVVDQVVERERVDLAGVVARDLPAQSLDQLAELGLVVGGYGGAGGSPLGLRRAGVRSGSPSLSGSLAIGRGHHNAHRTPLQFSGAISLPRSRAGERLRSGATVTFRSW